MEHDAASVFGSHVDSLLGSEVRTPISSRHCFRRCSVSWAENNTGGTRCAHYHTSRFRAIMPTSVVFWIQGMNALQPLLYGGREYCMRLCRIGENKGTPFTLKSADQERPKLTSCCICSPIAWQNPSHASQGTRPPIATCSVSKKTVRRVSNNDTWPPMSPSDTCLPHPSSAELVPRGIHLPSHQLARKAIDRFRGAPARDVAWLCNSAAQVLRARGNPVTSEF